MIGPTAAPPVTTTPGESPGSGGLGALESGLFATSWTGKAEAPTPAVSRPVALPERFGRYRILRRLGQGAMGAVYLALDTRLDRRVALKVPHLSPDVGGESGDRLDPELFYAEARAAAALDHPNLCPVYDAGQLDGIPFLAMAHLRGKPLSELVLRDRPMSQRRAAVLTHQLASALGEMHARGIIHRDLKPANIIVGSRRGVVVFDFGLACRVGSRRIGTSATHQFVGTPAYLAPERIAGDDRSVSPRCDIYSLGVILYELLTSRRPFEGSEVEVVAQTLMDEPPPPSVYRSPLNPRLEAICLRAMAREPEQRYASMGELADDLEPLTRPRRCRVSRT